MEIRASAEQVWLRSVAVMGLLYALVASTAAAQVPVPKPTACRQQSVVNGTRHQPTTAEIESAQSACGVSSPVDTSPAYGALIDELYRELQDEMLLD